MNESLRSTYGKIEMMIPSTYLRFLKQSRIKRLLDRIGDLDEETALLTYQVRYCGHRTRIRTIRITLIIFAVDRDNEGIMCSYRIR